MMVTLQVNLLKKSTVIFVVVVVVVVVIMTNIVYLGIVSFAINAFLLKLCY